MGCTDAVLTISHHRQKSQDAGKEHLSFCSTLVQIPIERATVVCSSNLNLYWCSGSVLSISREFLSDRIQRVVPDCATSEWIPIVSGVPQRSLLSPLLLILYTSEMLVHNRLCAYADDSTLPTVDSKPADRPAVAVSLKLTGTGAMTSA